MRRMTVIAGLAVASLVYVNPASAHPGNHAHMDLATLLKHAADPTHVGLVVVAIGAVLLLRATKRRVQRAVRTRVSTQREAGR